MHCLASEHGTGILVCGIRAMGYRWQWHCVLRHGHGTLFQKDLFQHRCGQSLLQSWGMTKGVTRQHATPLINADRKLLHTFKNPGEPTSAEEQSYLHLLAALYALINVHSGRSMGSPLAFVLLTSISVLQLTSCPVVECLLYCSHPAEVLS